MKRFIAAALALSLMAGAAGAASAQPYDHDRHGGYDHRDGYDHPGDRGYHRDDRGYHGDFHGGDRWAAHREWRRGGRIDRMDWRDAHRVDYRIHHLRRPPRGYEWREIDGRYVLAAVASGIIADIIINSR